jgi:hypothetical protein
MTSAPSGNTPIVTPATPVPAPGTPSGGGDPIMSPPTTNPEKVVLTAPFRAPSCRELEYASVYNHSSLCGETLGTLPGIDWFWGTYIVDDDGDGYLEYRSSAGLPQGNYAVTLIDRECGTERSQFWNLDYWGVGACGDIARMAPADRAFLYCDWFDAASGTTIKPVDNSPSCEARFTVVAGCAVVPNGNMRNYAAQGCPGLVDN